MQQRKDNFYEIVQKSFELLTKDIEKIDFDLLLNLIFDYLDLKLAWIGVLSDNNLKINKAKGVALNYINDESLRNHQLNILKNHLDKLFVSNDI